MAKKPAIKGLKISAELGPRVRMLHLKDGPAVHERPMTALGCGVLDFARILSATHNSTDLVVELDECASDIFEAVDVSLRDLHAVDIPNN